MKTIIGGICIGGNKILLEEGESALFPDFGINFKSEATFFDEPEILIPVRRKGFFLLLQGCAESPGPKKESNFEKKRSLSPSRPKGRLGVCSTFFSIISDMTEYVEK